MPSISSSPQEEVGQSHLSRGWAGGCEYPKLKEGELEVGCHKAPHDAPFVGDSHSSFGNFWSFCVHARGIRCSLKITVGSAPLAPQ